MLPYHFLINKYIKLNYPSLIKSFYDVFSWRYCSASSNVLVTLRHWRVGKPRDPLFSKGCVTDAIWPFCQTGIVRDDAIQLVNKILNSNWDDSSRSFSLLDTSGFAVSTCGISSVQSRLSQGSPVSPSCPSLLYHDHFYLVTNHLWNSSQATRNRDS